MTEFLMLVLMQVTIFSSVTACIIICVKQLFKWVIPPSVGVIMWVILLIRLLWPIFPESAVSVYNFIPAGRSIMYTLTNNIDDEISAREELFSQNSNPYVLDNSTEYSSLERVVNKSNLLYPGEDAPLTVGEYLADAVYAGKTKSENAAAAHTANVVLLMIYALGAAIALSANLAVYGKAKRKALSTALSCNDEGVLQVYRSTGKKLGIRPDKLPPLKYGGASMLVGCISPTVIYREDENAGERELSMVFAHELNHYKHKDNFVLLFSTVVTSLFWFNPLIWIVRHMIREDIEVMCDSRTISLCELRRAEYAEMIYHRSYYEKRMAFAGCRMSSGSRKLKNRIRTISRNLENKFIPRVASVVLCVCIIAICLTNPIVSQNIDYKDYIGNYSDLTGDSKQTMHLTSGVSVSNYLKQISTIINSNFDDSISEKIGNGSLENLKRIVQNGEFVSSDIKTKLSSMRTDQPLTVQNCVVINECIVAILSDGMIDASGIIPLVPKYISVSKMEALIKLLDEEDAMVLRRAYNRGVAGADVKLMEYYTEAMFQLILDRLDDLNLQDMWSGFYTKIELNDYNLDELCSKYNLTKEALCNENYLYVFSRSLDPNDKNILHGIIKYAYAGQDESICYLKENNGGYSEFTIRQILTRAGYDVETMLSDYAKIGIPQYEYYTSQSLRHLTKAQYDVIDVKLDGSGLVASEMYSKVDDSEFYAIQNGKGKELSSALEYLNEMTFIKIRDWKDSEVSIIGIADNGIKDAAKRMYSLGLIDATEGEIYLADQLSCGQGLYYSYKLVCSIVNANR